MDRLLENIDKDGPVPHASPELGPCWEWLGSRTKEGYGHINIRIARRSYVQKYVHRLMYQESAGVLDDASKVLHRCDNPGCANPSHLFLGTQADNMHDRDRKGRGYFKTGSQHPQAKLTDQDVISVRLAATDGSLIRREAMDRLGISDATLSRIISGKTWSHLLNIC